MEDIRFIRHGSNVWERAFTEEHLRMKLNGDPLAEVIHPVQPLRKRLLKFIMSLLRY